MLNKRTINVWRAASKWFYKSFEAQHDDAMGGGPGFNDDGWGRAAEHLLEECGYSAKHIRELKKKQERAFRHTKER